MSQPGDVPVTNEDLQRLATLEANYLHMTKQIDQMADDMRAVRATLDQAKGGWKTLVVIGGVAGAIGAALAKLTGH